MKNDKQKNVKIDNLPSKAKTWAMMAQFGEPIDQNSLDYLREEGFGDGRTRAVGCIGWIWCQWLLGTSRIEIARQIGPFVIRGMEMQSLSTKFYMRPIHDLYLLHCAIFASEDAQLFELARRVVDSSGYGKYKPMNDGELYASAWSGMLKYYLLGDRNKANEQSEIIWSANKDIAFKAASKQLVVPWLKGNWASFAKHQESDFDRLWERAEKDGTTTSKSEGKWRVDMRNISTIQHLWCWAHCGLAVLAARQGARVATDPFWFPPSALNS